LGYAAEFCGDPAACLSKLGLFGSAREEPRHPASCGRAKYDPRKTNQGYLHVRILAVDSLSR
jgi:hypothetical protein